MKCVREVDIEFSKRFWMKVIIGGMLILFVGIANAEEMVVAETSTAIWASEDGSGFAPDMFRAIKQAGQVELKLGLYPFARALNMFKTGEVACCLGGDEQAALDFFDMKVIASDPFLMSRMYAFTLRESPKITTVDQLRKQRVGAVRGTVPNILTVEVPSLKFEFASTTKQNFRKLQAGRIDVFVAYITNLPQDILSMLHYDADLLLYANEDKLLCQPSSQNQRYIDQFNMGLRTIQDNGKLKQLYDHYYSKNTSLTDE